MSSFDFKSVINNEFLSHILQKEIKSFEFCTGTNLEDNYLSSVYCIEVIFERTNDDSDNYVPLEVKHLFIKYYPEVVIPAIQEHDRILVIGNEYFIYDQFLPLLNKLAYEINKLQIDALIKAPVFYGGNIVGSKQSTFDMEPWTKNNFLVFENLRVKGFKMVERTKGLDLQHCVLAIHQLANIHSLSWVWKQRNDSQKLSEMHPHLQDIMSQGEPDKGWKHKIDTLNKFMLSVIQEEFGHNSDIAQRFQQLISFDVLEIIRKYQSGSGMVEEKYYENLLRVREDEVSSSASEEPWLVAVQGDCWINNFMFLYDNEEKLKSPMDVMLIDHTNFRESCLTTDLAYFMYSSIQPEDRISFTDVLLYNYFERFTQITEGLGARLPIGFTMEGLKRRWRRARIYGLIMFIQFLTFVHEPSLLQDVFEPNESLENQKCQVNDNKKWKLLLIQTVLNEYNDGIV